MTTELKKVTFEYPAIDNHAHPLLKATHRLAEPFEGLITEAQQEAAEDSIHTLACYRATRQLASLFGLKEDQATWQQIKEKRETIEYNELCRMSLKPTGIQCLLLDDGLGAAASIAEGYQWHDQFTSSPTKRIVRIEVVAQDILKPLIEALGVAVEVDELLSSFSKEFTASIVASGEDDNVAGFKSVACYRTGLDIDVSSTQDGLRQSLSMVIASFEEQRVLRLAEKTFNDYLIRIVLDIASRYKKPVQFHTGLGDNDIRLVKSSPAHMQEVIKAFPRTTFVLLHSSYPYTRDAGYLTSVYKNVYLDFGEIFPFLSADGQRTVIRQVLELCPTNKIMWSTDGHWWPESYYLGTVQARMALYEVLSDFVSRHELTEEQAISIVKGALFDNANSIYHLGLQPKLSKVL